MWLLRGEDKGEDVGAAEEAVGQGLNHCLDY
jgi:hypothetical protein